MKVHLKSPQEISIMREGGAILGAVIERTLAHAVPGVKTIDLEHFAAAEIKKAGGLPSFKTVKNYQYTTCMCVNDIVVHGIPNDYVLKENDILGIDCGVLWKGFHTDASWTVIIQNANLPVKNGAGAIKNDNVKFKINENINPQNPIRGYPPESQEKTTVNVNKSEMLNNTHQISENPRARFLEAGRDALRAALNVCRAGNRVWDIGQAIQDSIEKKWGYYCVHALTGHCIGRKLHEEPFIPCFPEGDRKFSALIQAGMVLAVEIIYGQKTGEVWYGTGDGWTINTRDKSLAGLFELTVAVNQENLEILTPMSGFSF